MASEALVSRAPVFSETEDPPLVQAVADAVGPHTLNAIVPVGWVVSETVAESRIQAPIDALVAFVNVPVSVELVCGVEVVDVLRVTTWTHSFVVEVLWPGE
jgi:hypothetical protein